MIYNNTTANLGDYVRVVRVRLPNTRKLTEISSVTWTYESAVRAIRYRIPIDMDLPDTAEQHFYPRTI